MAKTVEINWLEVRAGYEGGVKVRDLAQAFGIGSIGTISKRAAREGWAKPLRPGDVTGTGETPSVEKRKRAEKQRKRKQGVSIAVSNAPAADEAEPDEGDDEGEDDTLTERERRFVLHYACTGQPQLSARRAGCPWNSARYRARDMLARPRVQRAINEMRAERAARLGVSADRIVTELARVGLVNMTDLVKFGPKGVVLNLSEDLSPDDSAAIIEVSETKDGVKIKLAPKMNALRLLAEHTGVVWRRSEEKGADADDAAELPDAERTARLVALLDRARARRVGQAADGGDADLGSAARPPDDGL